MEILGMLLLIAGFIVFIFGGIWFLVESFRESIWWGLGCLLINPVEIIFLIVHWRVAAKPFGIQMIGLVLLLIGSFVSESGIPLGR
jgi:hypothetical protein